MVQLVESCSRVASTSCFGARGKGIMGIALPSVSPMRSATKKDYFDDIRAKKARQGMRWSRQAHKCKRKLGTSVPGNSKDRYEKHCMSYCEEARQASGSNSEKLGLPAKGNKPYDALKRKSATRREAARRSPPAPSSKTARKENLPVPMRCG